LLRFAPGQVICRQGDLADAFYLVRVGFVKVSQAHPGGEMVLAYLSRGDYFGETGLLRGDVRTASCTAIDHVEVVRISAQDFNTMTKLFPDVRKKFEVANEARMQINRTRLSVISSTRLKFLTQGLMEAQTCVAGLNSCTRCDAGVPRTPIISECDRLVREGLRFDHYLVALPAASASIRCMVGYPVGSIRRRNSLE
jgi:CRP-like cAMP-binding protein